MNCSICITDKIPHENMVWLDCSHNLCSTCYDSLTANSCPYCRTLITAKTKNLREQNMDSFINISTIDAHSYIGKQKRKGVKKRSRKKKKRFTPNKDRDQFQRKKKKFKKPRFPQHCY